MRSPTPTLIGVFALGAIAIIVAAVLFFAGGTLFATRLAAVSFFDGSVAGLQIGAPVTFRGVPVGRVTSMAVRVDPDDFQSTIRVDMELQPEKLAVHRNQDRYDANLVRMLTERGLSAKLVKPSFVTGLLAVELDFRPDIKSTRTPVEGSIPEIPSVPTAFEALTRKFEELDVAATLDAMQQTLASLNRILSDPELTRTIDSLPPLVEQLDRTLKTVDTEMTALSQTGRTAIGSSTAQLQKTLVAVERLAATLDREARATSRAAQATLQNADTAIDGVNTVLDPRGRTLIQIQRAVDDLAASAARLRSFADRVDRDPATLLRGR